MARSHDVKYGDIVNTPPSLAKSETASGKSVLSSRKQLLRLVSIPLFVCGGAGLAAADGVVGAWGNGDSGRLGDNATTNSSIPVSPDTSGVLSGKTVSQVAAGYNHSCAVTTDAAAYCWGGRRRRSIGQCGLARKPNYAGRRRHQRRFVGQVRNEHFRGRI